MKSLKERFEDRYIPVTESGCWLWIGSHNGKNYGEIRRLGRKEYAHRVSYELYIGPIPRGMFVCHKCDVTACVNPAHLFLGNHSDNMKDMMMKGRGINQFGTTLQ